MRELRRQKLVAPKLMVVSNLAAPQTEESSRPWRRNAALTENQFKDECRAWGVNEIVMKPNFWKNYHLPFRRDFTIFDEYVYEDGEPLETAVVAFLSGGDPRITKDLMMPWASQTKYARSFEVVDFQGDHFYVQDRKLVTAVVSKLAEYLKKTRDGTFPPQLEPAEEEGAGGDFLEEDIVRKINLLEILEEDYPDVDPPPEDCVGKNLRCGTQKQNLSFPSTRCCLGGASLTRPSVLACVSSRKVDRGSNQGAFLGMRRARGRTLNARTTSHCLHHLLYCCLPVRAPTSSPFSLISVMMSAPPMNSPFAYTCGIVGQSEYTLMASLRPGL